MQPTRRLDRAARIDRGHGIVHANLLLAMLERNDRERHKYWLHSGETGSRRQIGKFEINYIAEADSTIDHGMQIWRGCVDAARIGCVLFHNIHALHVFLH